jgi:hypothetical protein
VNKVQRRNKEKVMRSSYREMDHAAFIKNIDALERQLASQNRLAPVAGALNMVRGFTGKLSPGPGTDHRAGQGRYLRVAGVG